MSAHTEGRLTSAAGGFIHNDSGMCCAATSSGDTADALRLAACWNACDGFDTDQIENILVVGDTFKARFGMLQSEARDTLAERDQLRAELAAARALLAEVLEHGVLIDRDASDGGLTERIRALLKGEPARSDPKDAARYRWLRDKSEPGICAFYLSVGKAFDGVKFTRETVDEAIDDQIAMVRTEQGGAA